MGVVEFGNYIEIKINYLLVRMLKWGLFKLCICGNFFCIVKVVCGEYIIL